LGLDAEREEGEPWKHHPGGVALGDLIAKLVQGPEPPPGGGGRGVETEQQRAFLESRGGRGFRGYLFSRPLPPGEVEAYLDGA